MLGNKAFFCHSVSVEPIPEALHIKGSPDEDRSQWSYAQEIIRTLNKDLTNILYRWYNINYTSRT